MTYDANIDINIYINIAGDPKVRPFERRKQWTYFWIQYALAHMGPCVNI